MSDDGKYLILSVLVEYNAISLYYFDLDQYHEINGKISLTPIVTKFDYNYIVREIKFYLVQKLRVINPDYLFFMVSVHRKHWIKNGIPYK